MNLLAPTGIDLQSTAPDHAIALDSVGVTGVVRSAIVAGLGPSTLRIDVSTSLSGDVRGAHMSRFHEAVDAGMPWSVDAQETTSLADAAQTIAAAAVLGQDANRATASIRGTFAARTTTPASDTSTTDPFDAWSCATVPGRADSAPRGAAAPRVTIGVAVTGMTACPCAQALVRDAGAERLRTIGFDDEQVAAALGALGPATHNQRGTTTLELTACTQSDAASLAAVDVRVLVDLARDAMSARTHELLKRPDELAVVEAAHARPRFVEDCVRSLLAAVAVRAELRLLDDVNVSITQRNHESIHAHDVEARRSARLGDLRQT